MAKFSIEICEDLAQETFLKLCRDKCRLLLSFATKAPEAIEGYVRMVAINLARDYFKSEAAQRRGRGQVEQFPDHFEPESSVGGEDGQFRADHEVLVREIGACLEKCLRPPDDRRDRTIFWLYYREGWTAGAIAELPTIGLGAKGVESAIARLTRMIRQELVNGRAGAFNQGAHRQNETGLESRMN
jgi:RNA polymerase sigma-70 factor (ECF subfamily)